MLNTCPNKSTVAWSKIFARANGNEEEAMRLWIEEGYAQNESLNIEINDETFADERQGEPDKTDPEKDNKFSKLIEHIKTHLAQKLAMLENRKVTNKSQKQAEYNNIIAAVEGAQGVESINMFVRDAYSKGERAKRVLSTLLKNKDTYDKKQVLRELTAIAEFANGYSILDEIDKADVYEYFTTKVDPNIPDSALTPQQMLAKAITTRENIKSKYLTEGIPLMAKFLLGFKTDVSAESQVQIDKTRKQIEDIIADPKVADIKKKKRIAELEERITKFQGFSIDEQQMIDLLKQVNQDESILDFLISPLISSEDSALALFAKAIKSKLETARLDDIKIEREVASDFEAYKKSTRANQDNVAKFNEGIYEELVSYHKDKETGEIKQSKRMAFVQEYDITAYRKAEAEMYASVGPKQEGTGLASDEAREKHRKVKIGIWYSRNTQLRPKAEIDAIIAAKQKELNAGIITHGEYEAWTWSKEYKSAISMPSKKYLNSKWTALYNPDGTPKNAKGIYHKQLLDRYLKAQEKLPPSKQKGYILPSVPKTDLERAVANGIINTVTTNIKDATQFQAYDVEFGLGTLSKEGVKFLPAFYTQSMQAEDVSLDLARSVLLFSAMANRYEALDEVSDEIALFKTIIGERVVAETNSKGKPIIDAFANKLGYTEYLRQNGLSNSKMHVNAFLDMVVYGEMQKAEEILGFSGAKITNTISAFSAITTISMDLLKGIANNLQGNIQMIIEANSAQFFAKKDLAAGKRFYNKSIPSMLGDFGKPVPTSLVGMLMDRYDAIQGNFKDTYGKNITASMARKLFSSNTLFFNQQLGEHEIQVSGMLALMNATKLIDKASGQEISLLAAHEKYGAEGVEENTDFTERKRQDFQNRLHALNKRMHGVYNDFDKGTMQRYSLGRLSIMYRKHLVPGYKRRWKDLSMDEELGMFTEGFYRTFWNTFIRDLRDYKFNLMQNWSTYTPFEKAQIKRTIAEITIVLTTAALIAILKSMVSDDDDDELKKNFAYNFVLYEMIRMRSETASYINPNDAYRVVKSPSAMTTTLERGIKFADQFFVEWDPEKLSYTRDQGVWHKGDNKSWAYFLKLMGYSGYNITPEAAVKSFEGTLNK